jgi:hypothetical protein
LVFPRPGADYVAPGKNIKLFLFFYLHCFFLLRIQTIQKKIMSDKKRDVFPPFKKVSLFFYRTNSYFASPPLAALDAGKN